MKSINDTNYKWGHYREEMLRSIGKWIVFRVRKWMPYDYCSLIKIKDKPVTKVPDPSKKDIGIGDVLSHELLDFFGL